MRFWQRKRRSVAGLAASAACEGHSSHFDNGLLRPDLPMDPGHDRLSLLLFGQRLPSFESVWEAISRAYGHDISGRTEIRALSSSAGEPLRLLDSAIRVYLYTGHSKLPGQCLLSGS